jgi:hypothetical protein
MTPVRKKYRWTEPTPAYWRKVRNYAGALAAMGTAILAADSDMPEIVLDIAGYMVVAGLAVAAFAQTAHAGE